MKMFNNAQKNMASNLFEKEIKPRLKEKDGFTHVIMVNSFSKLCNQNFGCEDKYTTQLDEILTNIQMLGYEIVDIKVTVMQNQGLNKQMEGFNIQRINYTYESLNLLTEASRWVKKVC